MSITHEVEDSIVFFPSIQDALTHFCPEPIVVHDDRECPEWLSQLVEFQIELPDGMEIDLGRFCVPASLTDDDIANIGKHLAGLFLDTLNRLTR